MFSMGGMVDVIVQASDLHKHFGRRHAVRGVDFTIRRGICFGILGPNGAGKTTLMRMLIGMSPVSDGEYTAFNEHVGNSSLRRRMGVVPQMDNLDPDFTVRENLLVYASFFGLSRDACTQRVDELLNFTELSGRSDHAVSKLSGGMRRRLMIARALINDPDLIILDEPTTGLDPQARHMIWQRLQSLKRSGKTLVLTTHYMEEAERLCDELIILDEGKVLAEGTPRQLVSGQVEPEVVELRGGTDDVDVESLGRDTVLRRDKVGDTWFFYTADARPLLAHLNEVIGIQYIHRPANLEDVFLRLTGRELRD